ncbi:MAG TPA: hypothetical protein VL049_10915 [Candidatus Dormibacteraeota bacterium]|nr:hypothetical protein [Candidatus Dormibacteraeota bacterium]
MNSNHVLVFDDPKVAAVYAAAFQTAWDGKVKKAVFQSSPLANTPSTFASKTTPPTTITFAPHTDAVATAVLQDVTDRIAKEGKKGKSTGSVLFAVMQVDGGVSPVYTALRSIHENTDIFSFGISDTTSGIRLYVPGKRTGVLVTGKPKNTVLPPPFNQVPGITFGHQVHHKFVVCGFNRHDAVVYCGSSNLAQGGESLNGDNLLAISDVDVATAFAIEAVGLVDHFNFLDRFDLGPKSGKAAKTPPASLQQAALTTGWHLSTTDKWAAPYYDTKDHGRAGARPQRRSYAIALTAPRGLAKRARMRLLPILLLTVALVAPAGIARGAWSVDAAGGCVEQWGPSDMLRGPTAIVNGPILPFRQMAGGAEYAWNTKEWWPWQIVAMGPGVTLFSGAAGLLEGTWWVVTGVADTLTGGYFGAAPEAATELSVQPQVSTVITDAAPTPAPTEDRCGRPLAAP